MSGHTSDSNRRSARKKLQQKFGMKNCHEIIDNPERENIKLFLKKVKCSTPLDEVFYFIIRLLKDKNELCPRFLFFRSSLNVADSVLIDTTFT
jgi:superfamily II DNA helicase RecQ